MGNKDIFDQMADRYDAPGRMELAEISLVAIQKQLAGTNTADKTAIDFGSGTGLIGLPLAQEFDKMLLIDSSQNMVNFAAEKIKKNSIRNAKAVYLDLEREEGILQPVDFIFLVQVLLHIRDYKEVLRKLFSLSKPGGHFIIIDFDQNNAVTSDLVHSGFKPEVLSGDLGAIGFQTIAWEIFHRGANIFMNQGAFQFIMDAGK